MKEVLCHYCGGKALLVSGDIVYPHRPDLYDLKFWYCEKDLAYVGVHKGTTNPLGRLANAELRKYKSAAHTAFDPIWRLGKKTRNEAYAWLALQLNIPTKACHIGEFDVDQCKAVIEACKRTTAVHRTHPYPPKAT